MTYPWGECRLDALLHRKNGSGFLESTPWVSRTAMQTWPTCFNPSSIDCADDDTAEMDAPSLLGDERVTAAGEGGHAS
jgi:hypothetical protein